MNCSAPKWVWEIREDSGVGIKPISIFGTKRLARMAIQYAIDHGRRSVTFVHKGNIMKFTEGAFCAWGYELAKEEFAEQTITEDELYSDYDGKCPEGKIIVNDRIADSMLQQILTRTDEYDVIVTPNLNGDYLSDAAAAQVGGIGMGTRAEISVMKSHSLKPPTAPHPSTPIKMLSIRVRLFFLR